VLPYLPAAGQLLGQGLLYQSVAELVALLALWEFFNQVRFQRLIDHIQQLIFRYPLTQYAQQPEIELPSNNGCNGQGLVALGGQPVEPSPNDLQHTGRYDGSHGAGSLRLLQFSTFVEKPYHLSGEERVAFGAGIDGIYQLLSWPDASSDLNEPSSIFQAQATQ
jgi:hypothetical protein